MALALPAKVEVSHFDRQAFRARRIFCTLAASGQTANLCLAPDDQAHWCGLLPDALSPVPNRWRARGWTEVALERIEPADLDNLLRRAWLAGGGKAETPASDRKRNTTR